MATSNQDHSAAHDFWEFAYQASQTLTDTLKQTSTLVGETFGTALYEFVEQGTETIGQVVSPIATHPATKFATKVPGVSWLMAALGQVDVDRVLQDVESLRQKYPQESSEALVQRVIGDTAQKAAAIGLTTGVVPPLALMLLAVDLGAIAALQAEMIYRIATIYGFSPTEPARRGEVLAIWGLSTGSSTVVKSGLILGELVPIVGTVISSAGDAALLYGMGQVACQFYAAKRRAMLANEGRPPVA